MDSFRSDDGADNFNHLWMAGERAKKYGQDWLWPVLASMGQERL